MEKVCTKCEQRLPTSEFTKDKQKKDGFRSSCKNCNRDYNRAKMLENCEAVKRYNREKNKVVDLDGEIWKDIPEYEGLYQVSNFGRIKSEVRQGGGGLCKFNTSPQGYHYVSATKDTKTKKIMVHRAIALCFIDGYQPGYMVDHINRVRTDNSLQNLRWVDARTNVINRDVTGCVHKCTDKRKIKLADGTEKELTYEYYRVQYPILQENGEIKKYSKRFKTEDEANTHLEEIRNRHAR